MCSTWETVWVKQGCMGVVVAAMISAGLTRPDHGRPLGFGLCGWLRRVSRVPAIRLPCPLLWSWSG